MTKDQLSIIDSKVKIAEAIHVVTRIIPNDHAVTAAKKQEILNKLYYLEDEIYKKMEKLEGV